MTRACLSRYFVLRVLSVALNSAGWVKEALELVHQTQRLRYSMVRVLYILGSCGSLSIYSAHIKACKRKKKKE